MMKVTVKTIFFSTLLLCLCSSAAQGQIPLSEAEILCMQAEEKHNEYDFEAALEFYKKAKDITRDSLKRVNINAAIVRSENGLNLTEYTYKPTVVSRERFSEKDFFLYYPLPDNSWRPAPNQLDSLGGAFARATYFRERDKRICYSAIDSTGVRTLFETHFADTAWTAPAKMRFSSDEGEAYPLLQGNKLYFSSKGLYGMGGYDLYVSTLNPETGEWSAPENLGFPFSSTGDDFLYMNTRDGKYTIFASNRACPADSVDIFVIEFDSMPVRSTVTDPATLREIAALNPQGTGSKINNRSALRQDRRADENTAKYADAMKHLRDLRDDLAAFVKDLEAKRSLFGETSDQAQKAKLQEQIMAAELELPAKNAAVETASKELQAIEMDFLMNGVILDPTRVEADADKEVVGVGKAYSFTKKNEGSPIDIKLCL